MAHVVIVGALAMSMEKFRGDLIRVLAAAGHRVTAMSASTSADEVQRICALGANFRALPVQRNGLNPCQDLQTFFALRRAFKELKPDVVLAYTIKPVIWGGLALTKCKHTRSIALITGLGFAFQERGHLRKALTHVITQLYRIALRRLDSVVFQNPDNLETFVSRGIVVRSKCHVVNGSGVNCDYFTDTPLPAGPPRFLLIARFLGEKGLREYAEAARIAKQRHSDAAFQLVGFEDPSPDAVPMAEVRAWHEEGVIQYLGEASDVRPFLADCHVYVLPSYHEGMPRSVLEAMAMGRPILTTDVPGCRETVVPGENGYLVSKADVAALAERMIWFIENRDQWQRMGQASRRMAEERFDVRKVNAELLRIMDLSLE
jgi:glycosyltransferase involved in cell wall biosynthesis